MSLIGSKPISLPEGVQVTTDRNRITVKGSKGELVKELPIEKLTISIEDNQVVVGRKNEAKQTKAFHGLVRSLINGMIVGVSKGFEKRLELVGTGYRVAKQGKKLVLSLGFSHPIDYPAPEGVELEIEGNNIIIVKGIDKQKVGQAAAEIRSKRKPEPYKGKGVRYKGEVVRRKAGKTASV